jgi:dTDP-4-amino-4,6-dideoxygalactose transaminase
MSGNELKYVEEAFNDNWIAPVGKNVDEFENALRDYLDIPHVIALNSGTAALHLALINLGVEPGDEVIVSTFTFVGSVNPIIYQSATPIFVDNETETWNMDPEKLEEAIKDRLKKGRKPKAIILVHLYGMPAKIEEILDISTRYDIPVIEDAAESLGSKYKGKHLGTFGEMGILSFNGNKIITTSGGGALISNDKKYTDHALFLAMQAKNKTSHYEHTDVGFNYRMSNISAGIGRGQMEVLNERIRQRRANFEFYYNELKDYPGIEFLQENGTGFSNFWLTTMLVKKNGSTSEQIRIALEKENIEARPLWKPMHLQPIFREYPFYGNGTSKGLFNKGLCLPSGSNLTQEDKRRIVDTIHHVLS